MGLMRIAMIGSRSYPAAHGGIEVAVEELSAALAGAYSRMREDVGPTLPKHLFEFIAGTRISLVS